MADESAPKVESARYVIPFEADTTAVDAALERLDQRASEIASKIKDALSKPPDGPSVVESAVSGVRQAAPPAKEEDGGGESLGGLLGEVRKNTEALNEVRDAIEALTEAIASMTLSETL